MTHSEVPRHRFLNLMQVLGSLAIEGGGQCLPDFLTSLEKLLRFYIKSLCLVEGQKS
jgi:hypothetical protein